jgi:hypothetical protein
MLKQIISSYYIKFFNVHPRIVQFLYVATKNDKNWRDNAILWYAV